MTGDAGTTSGGRLAFNTVVNAAGFLVTAVALLVVYPLLIENLGESRMGVFLLILTIAGYFSIFDLGVNRALTRYLSIELAKGDPSRMRQMLMAGLALLFCLGILVTIALFLLAPLFISPAASELRNEAVSAIRIIALSMVFLMLNAGLRSVFESRQQFFTLNLVTIPGSLFNYLAPLIVTAAGGGLTHIAWLMLAGRIGVFIVMLSLANTGGLAPPAVSDALALLRFGGWLTVSRIINPLFLYFDRFFISAVLTLGDVAVYTTPFELTMRLLIFAQTFLAVLFPAYSALAGSDRKRFDRVRESSSRFGIAAMTFAVALVVLFANPFLSWWISPDFASRSAIILQILAVGVLVNYAAHFPAAMLQAGGRPDVSAKLQMAELPVYIGALWLLIQHFGLTGAALAWSGRVVVDAVLHFFWSEHLFPSGRQARRRLLILLALGACLFAVLFALLVLTSDAILFSAPAMAAFVLLVWLYAFGPGEKQFAASLLKGRRGESGT